MRCREVGGGATASPPARGERSRPASGDGRREQRPPTGVVNAERGKACRAAPSRPAARGCTPATRGAEYAPSQLSGHRPSAEGVATRWRPFCRLAFRPPVRRSREPEPLAPTSYGPGFALFARRRPPPPTQPPPLTLAPPRPGGRVASAQCPCTWCSGVRGACRAGRRGETAARAIFSLLPPPRGRESPPLSRRGDCPPVGCALGRCARAASPAHHHQGLLHLAL